MTEKSKLKQSIAMLVAVTLLTTGVTSYAAMTRQKELIVLKDNEVHEVSTRANTVGELLDELGYIASDRTILNMPADAEITDYMEIVVTTKNTVELHLRGVSKEIHTQANTVGEFLDEQGFTAGENDLVYPDLQTPVKDHMTVTVDTIVTEEEVEEESIPYETEYRATDDLYEGETRVAQEGEDGTRQFITQTIRHNGRRVSANTQEVITKEPATHIIEEGTLVYVEPVQEAQSSSSSSSYTESAATEASYSNAGGWMDFTATAYDPTVGDTTRMGTPARVGVIAVDPSVIPLGSTVEVEGYGVYSAEDTGGAINGRKIDIFLSSHQEAINFGVRSVRVRILN